MLSKRIYKVTNVLHVVYGNKLFYSFNIIIMWIDTRSKVKIRYFKDFVNDHNLRDEILFSIPNACLLFFPFKTYCVQSTLYESLWIGKGERPDDNILL